MLCPHHDVEGCNYARKVYKQNVNQPNVRLNDMVRGDTDHLQDCQLFDHKTKPTVLR